MSSDLPVVVPPQPAEAHAPESEAVLTPPESAQEPSEPAWLSWAAPLVPEAAQGVSRALLDLLQQVGIQVPTVADLARATVQAACGIAEDASVPPAVRVAALATR